MHLTLLKTDGRVVAWVDGQHVVTGKNVDHVFGQLSNVLEDAVRDQEKITASWETSWETSPGNQRTYPDPSSIDLERSRVQLSCFNGALVTSADVAQAPH